MKKFLAIILIVFTMLSTSALAAETTFAEPFTLFDFGTESRLDDLFKGGLRSYWEFVSCNRVESEDSWTLICTATPDYSETMDLKLYKSVPKMAIYSISSATMGVYSFDTGWGTYKAIGYDADKNDWVYGNEWVGKNQFMKLRIKNMTSNERISIFLGSQKNMLSYKQQIIEIGSNDTEFQTYVIDMMKAGVKGTTRGNYADFINGGAWCAWAGGLKDEDGNVITDTMEVTLFGSWHTTKYASASDITYMFIEVGSTVEIDYMIFAPTAEMAAEYKSIDEGYIPPETTTTETTTTEKVTTTTESVVETTTTESVVETTTTESIVETTTTESIVETTTTEAVVDQTTTPQDNSTTTTEQNTDGGKDGGFPVWIIIVIVVVIGGGVAAFFVFKKK